MLFSVSATPSLPSSSSVAQNCFAVSPTFPLFQILEQRAAFSMSLFLIWMPISWRTFHDLLVAGGAVPRFPLPAAAAMPRESSSVLNLASPFGGIEGGFAGEDRHRTGDQTFGSDHHPWKSELRRELRFDSIISAP